MDPRLPFLVASNGRITPSLNSFILSSRLREVMLATHGPSAASRLGVWSIRRPCSETPPLLRPPLLIASVPGWDSRSRRMPCEPLDAPDDLRKQALSQPAFGQLQEYRACRMRRPPVLKSRCCRLVSDQLWMASGRMSRRRRLPRL